MFRWVGAICLVATASSAGAAVTNGDFEDGLNGWTTTPGGWTTIEPPPGGNHLAITDSGGQLSQIFNIPAGAQRLEFDFKFFNNGMNPNEPLSDSVSFALEDPSTGDSLVPPIAGLEIIPIFFNHTASGFISFNPASVTYTPAGPNDPDRISLDISHLSAGQNADIVFRHLNFNDGLSSFLVLDNVVVTVPEPGTGLMVMAGVFVFARRRRAGSSL
jgi:hypothetical protein